MSFNRLSILIYHRVLDKPDAFNPHEIDRVDFYLQMKWVNRIFNVLSLDEAVIRLNNGTLPPRALCITFDDGYKDNCTNALPILIEHGLSATFFVATGFLNGGIMWNDSIIEAFRNTNQQFLDLSRFGFGQYALSSDKSKVLNEVIEKIKFLNFSDRLAAIEDVKVQLKVIDPIDLMMTDDEVRYLSASGMFIGGHTVRHPILSKLEVDEARSEIVQGKIELEKIIEKEIKIFAYPNGKPGRDYKKEHVELVREAGFEVAVSTAWGVASRHSDIFQLPRFTPWDKGIGKFLLRLYKNRFSAKEDLV